MRDPVPASRMFGLDLEADFYLDGRPTRVGDLRLTPSVTEQLGPHRRYDPQRLRRRSVRRDGTPRVSFSIASGDRIDLSALASGLYFVRVGETVRGVTLREVA